MQIWEWIEWTLSPSTKFFLCSLILLAIYVVYIWEPKKQNQKKEGRNEGLMNYVEVDPHDLAGHVDLLYPSFHENKQKTYNETLERLEEYVKLVKEQTK